MKLDLNDPKDYLDKELKNLLIMHGESIAEVK